MKRLSRHDTTIESIKKLVTYDPLTGFFFSVINGKKVGSLRQNGYVYISLRPLGRQFYAHRLAYWLMVGDPVPSNKYIDHINGIRNDNSWVNLRCVTPSLNSLNRDKARQRISTNIERGKQTTRKHLKFVRTDKTRPGEFRAVVSRHKKRIYLGTFSSEAEAHAAAVAFSEKHQKKAAQAKVEKAQLTVEKALEHVIYCPCSGTFRHAQKGTILGSEDCWGYIRIKILQCSYRAHRLAWFLSFGHWPEGHLDHIDGDRKNNKLGNLRVISASDNNKNRKTYSVSGEKHVYKGKDGKWVVCRSSPYLYGGRFESLQDAIKQRDIIFSG